MHHKRHALLMGGALLWCCDWKRNELFATIFNKYSQFLAHHKIDTVVFGGYTLSTKDATHQKRSGKISQTVDISDDNRCPSDRNTFFSNYTNKESFVKSLAKKLKPTFKVIECPSDADATIVKEALAVALDAPVTVFSDDTDILCLLVHHANKMSRNKLRNILLTDMTKKKKQQREYYNVKDVIDKFYADVVDYLLYMHLPDAIQHLLSICLVKLLYSENYLHLQLLDRLLIISTMISYLHRKLVMQQFDFLNHFIQHLIICQR